jgi:hypothetical protein
MVLANFSARASMTSSAPGSSAMPTTTRAPSLVAEMLLGWPLSRTLVIVLPLARSMASSVLSASLLT